MQGTLHCFTDRHILLGLLAIFLLLICALLIPFLGLVATEKLKVCTIAYQYQWHSQMAGRNLDLLIMDPNIYMRPVGLSEKSNLTRLHKIHLQYYLFRMCYTKSEFLTVRRILRVTLPHFVHGCSVARHWQGIGPPRPCCRYATDSKDCCYP